MDLSFCLLDLPALIPKRGNDFKRYYEERCLTCIWKAREVFLLGFIFFFLASLTYRDSPVLDGNFSVL